MDTRRLAAFIKVVDVGSVTRAASLLHVAQPALSQQIVALEAEFRQQLLIRSSRGVVPTEAGRTLYRHAQAILRQLDEAQLSVRGGEPALSGHVKVGLAPFSTATMLALPLLRQVRQGYPGIVLHIRDYFGTVLSELVLGGQLEMAVLYDIRPVRGLRLQRLLEEEWFLVATPGTLAPRGAAGPVAIEELAPLDLLLPTKTTFLRSTVEAACAQAGFTPRVVAEIESPAVLAEALAEGMGSTILPWSMAMAVRKDARLEIRRVGSTALKVTMSLCVSETAPLSDAALAVHDLLAAEVRALIARWPAPPRDAG